MRGIAILGDANKGWSDTKRLQRLTFSMCGVRFQGEEAVVEAIKVGIDSRLQRAELERSELLLLRGPDGNCSDHATARTLLLTTARLTISHATDFRFQKDAVGPPFDLLWIPQVGELQLEQVADVP